jgi:hypothetical protein
MYAQVNRVTSFVGYHISYDPRSSAYGCETTALVLNDDVFFVLRGCHQAEMKAASLAGGLDACMDFFVQHLEQAHAFSEHNYLNPTQKDRFGLAKRIPQYLSPSALASLKAAMGVTV